MNKYINDIHITGFAALKAKDAEYEANNPTIRMICKNQMIEPPCSETESSAHTDTKDKEAITKNINE